MAAFPPVWQIHRDSEFPSILLLPLADAGTTVHTLIKLGDNHRSTGTFRLGFSGSSGVTAHFSMARVLANPPPDLANIVLTYSAKLEDVTPPVNSMATPWRDLGDLLKDRSVLPGAGPDQGTVLKVMISALNLLPKDKQGVGTSLRWAVAGTPQGTLQLELQALPSPARLLTKNNLKGDNAVSVLVCRIPLHAELFDGSSHAGPVPLLFSPDRKAARVALDKKPGLAHNDIMAVNDRFIHAEHLSLAEAVAYLQAPKARGAKGYRMFAATTPPMPDATEAAPTPTPGPSKRPRLSATLQTDNETGTVSILSVTRYLSIQSFATVKSNSVYWSIPFTIRVGKPPSFPHPALISGVHHSVGTTT